LVDDGMQYDQSMKGSTFLPPGAVVEMRKGGGLATGWGQCFDTDGWMTEREFDS